MNTEWFKDENFWRDLYPYMFDARRMSRTPEEVDGIIDLLSLKTTDVIVDFGCGTGRHLLELAQRGYTDLTGIDSTAFYIDIAKKDAAKHTQPPHFVVGDMLDAVEPQRYDVGLSLFSSFGYYDKHEDNLHVLRNMYESLRGGGKILIDLRGKENFAYNFDAQSWGRIEESIILTQRVANDDFSKITNSWVVIKDGSEKTYTFTHWIYSAQELKVMLHEVGFNDINIYGDWAGGAYVPQSKRMIVIATKS